MGTGIGFLIRRGERPKCFIAVMALVALVCAVVIEALRGHDCTGDGCILCFATAFAYVLLLTSVGIALTRCVVWVFAELRAVYTGILPRQESHPLRIAASCTGRVELTPVTAGVRLVI